MTKKFADFGPSTFGETPKEKVKCYHTHPALPIDEFKVYGGSCLSPIVKDADVYVGFDQGMAGDPILYPWNGVEAVLFPIQDMGVPDHDKEFKKLVTWVVDKIKAGKKVHMGCIGGHGRTGLVMAAVYFVMTGDKDAIKYVRQHYCHKVVESMKQINYLHQLYGITKVEPSKKEAPARVDQPKWYGGMADAMFGGGNRVNALVPKELIDVPCLFIKGSVWGDSD